MFSLQNHKTIHTNKQMGKIIHLHQEIITTHKHKQHLKGLSKPCCTISYPILQCEQKMEGNVYFF